MGYTYYQLKILIPDPTPDLFHDIFAKLQKRFKSGANTTVAMPNQDRITVTHNDWTYTLAWEDNEYLEELHEMGRVVFKDNETNKQIVLNAKASITAWGEPDPNMDYFNDFVFIQHALDEIPNIYLLENETEIRPSDATKE